MLQVLGDIERFVGIAWMFSYRRRSGEPAQAFFQGFTCCSKKGGAGVTWLGARGPRTKRLDEAKE